MNLIDGRRPPPGIRFKAKEFYITVCHMNDQKMLKVKELKLKDRGRFTCGHFFKYFYIAVRLMHSREILKAQNLT